VTVVGGADWDCAVQEAVLAANDAVLRHGLFYAPGTYFERRWTAPPPCENDWADAAYGITLHNASNAPAHALSEGAAYPTTSASCSGSRHDASAS
jgi:hypothetical protein